MYESSYDGMEAMSSGLLGGLLGFGAAIYLLLFFVVFAFILVCQWKVYKKMGEEGWISLIPIYNVWVICKHAWGNGWMMFTYLIPLVGGIMSMVTYFKLFQKFGKSTLFCVFGMFFTPVMMAICAFDSSEFDDAIV